jgi:hypothetical protein
MNIKIVIEKYVNDKARDNKMSFPPIPWKWSVYSGPTLIKYGYAHTEEDANMMANQAISQ